jgi:folate-binding protein YgfZ
MQDWLEFLHAQGATLEDGTVANFGDPTAERLATRDGDVLMDLSQYAVVKVSGDDRIAFLHGQFTNDLNALDPDHWQPHAYCTAKGRALALLQVVAGTGDQLLLVVERSLRDGLISRLNMFRLRAKVSLEASDDFLCLGLSGPGTEAALTAAGLPAPDADQSVARHGATLLLHQQGPSPRFLVIASASDAQALWHQLAQHARPVGSTCWTWLNVVSGQPRVTADTAESFVPQMLNLDLLGAINFKKGCYPGQEIVARTHYLGKLKSRMVRAWTDAPEAPRPGMPLYATGFGDQAAGHVVDAAAAPDGGWDLLAVVRLEVLGEEPLTLGAPGGAVLVQRELPYPLEQTG